MELILRQVAVACPVSQPKKANLLLGCVQTRVLVVTLRRHLGERGNAFGVLWYTVVGLQGSQEEYSYMYSASGWFLDRPKICVLEGVLSMLKFLMRWQASMEGLSAYVLQLSVRLRTT